MGVQLANNGSGSIGSNDAPLNRIAELLEATVRLQLGPICERELGEPKMRELYESTGTTTANVLAKRLHLSKPTICAKWKRWEQLGMLVKQGKFYRKVV